MVYLEDEVRSWGVMNFDYANEYLSYMYDANDVYNSSAKNLDLLLGVQGWRYCIFCYSDIIAYSTSAYTMSDDNYTTLETIFSFDFAGKNSGAGGGGGGGGIFWPLEEGMPPPMAANGGGVAEGDVVIMPPMLPIFNPGPVTPPTT
jgi:hypothetical protein